MNNYITQDRPNPIWYISGKKNEYFAKVNKTFMGRDALSILLSNLSPKKVLIPAYICNEIINEFEKRNIQILYYDINTDFSICIEDIIKLIIKNNIDLFYSIIYFGFEFNNKELNQEIKRMCPNVFILEDRAHYLSNSFNFNHCNAYIFSFRKLLPIPEGGGYITTLEFKTKFSGTLVANILPFLMFLKKMILGYNDHYNRTTLTKNSKISFLMPISLLSKNIIRRYNYEKEIEFRRLCYNKWLIKLKKTSIKPVFQTIYEKDIPQGCPIFVDDALNIQKYMQRKKYYLRRHWKLRDEISGIAPISYSLSNSIITLPIYWGINDEIQDDIINLLLLYYKI